MEASGSISTAFAQGSQEPLARQAGSQGDAQSESIASPALPLAPDCKNTLPVVTASDPWCSPDAEDPSWHGKLLPHFRLTQYFDDNIFIQPTNKTADFVTLIGLGIRAGWGDVENPLTPIRDRRGVPLLYQDPEAKPGNFLLADYTGTPVLYANTSSQDTYNQDALLKAGWTDTRLSIGLLSRFQSTTISEIDVGELVKQKIYSDGLDVKYALTEKSGIESTFAFVRTDYPAQYISTNDWRHEDWLNYQLTSKINTGPGFGIGITEIQNSGDQTFEQLLYRASYQSTEKLSFTGRAGLELRQLEDEVPSRQIPIFFLGATYALFPGTSVEVDSFRDVGVSALLFGQDYIETGVTLTIRQCLIQKLHLTFSGSFENLDYLPVAANVVATRNDDYFVGKAAVAFDVMKWCTAQVFYIFQRDCSTQGANSFVDNQVGFEWNFAY
jgi:hypothetical protein